MVMTMMMRSVVTLWQTSPLFSLNSRNTPLTLLLLLSPPPPPSPPRACRRFSMAASTQSTPAAHQKQGDADNMFQLIQSHQETACRLPPVEEIRTLLDCSVRGVLSTLSHKYEGYPSGSMVDFACDADGSPILAVSTLALHTKDLTQNPKCSLLVARDPDDRTDLLVTVHGDAVPVSEKDQAAIRTAYLARHPDAFWVTYATLILKHGYLHDMLHLLDYFYYSCSIITCNLKVDFGDFHFMRIEPKVVRYVSGVATALLGSGEFNSEEYKAAKVDLIAQFSKPVASHMNKDHAEDTKAIVQHSTSIPVHLDYKILQDKHTEGYVFGCAGIAI